MLNCKVGTLPTTYLGLPLGASSKDLAVCNPLFERVAEKVLIKSTRSSIPTYFMSLLQAPGKVTEVGKTNVIFYETRQKLIGSFI